jgi:lysophospholipase L1-like esterase
MFDTGPIRRNVVVAAVCATVGCSAPIDSADRERIVSAALTEDDAASTQWTGTWSASPESCGAGTQLGGRTLRQIVHTSIGGSAVRVEVSNVFGTSALAIADVHVAQRASDSSITQGTDHSVTFGGEAAASVAAGALAVSDPVALEVAPLSDVSVSIYFPLSTGASETCHSTALQTSYIASGDLSGAPNLSGAVTTGSYFFLTAIDVRNSAASGALVTLGASITDGIASASDDDRRWPNDLAVRLTNAGQTVGVLNQGISGNQLLVDGSGQSALHRLGRDVLAQAGVRWVVFADDPINDLGDSHSTAAQLIAGLKQLIVMAHQSGVAFLCATLTPFQGAAYWSSTEETEREAYDTFVRTENSGCDRVVDMDGATHDPANPTMYLPAYDSGDHLHPNEAGLQAMANAVALDLFAYAVTPDAGQADEAGTGAHDGSTRPDATEPEAGSGAASETSEAASAIATVPESGQSGATSSGSPQLGSSGATSGGAGEAAPADAGTPGSVGDVASGPRGCSLAPSPKGPGALNGVLAWLATVVLVARRRRRWMTTRTVELSERGPALLPPASAHEDHAEER